MQCDYLERRIKGIYQRIRAELGIEVSPDMEKGPKVRESIGRRGLREKP